MSECNPVLLYPPSLPLLILILRPPYFSPRAARLSTSSTRELGESVGGVSGRRRESEKVRVRDLTDPIDTTKSLSNCRAIIEGTV